jgi:uncharacterized protein
LNSPAVGHAEAADARRRSAHERLVSEATERLRQALDEAGISQAHLGRLLNTSRANVSALLSGGRNMTLHTISDLAFALGQRVTIGLEPLPPQARATGLEIPRGRIAEFCRRHHIRRLSLFGSALRDDFGSDSDVDLLVEFEEGHTPGLAFFTLHEELADIFQRPVDLLTRRSVETSPNHIFREEALSRVETIYEAA